MDLTNLACENVRYCGTGGVSENSRQLGFRPAFLDAVTGEIYLSRFQMGGLAPIHVLDGLPDTLVEARDFRGHVTQVKASLVSGFERCGEFFTRDEARRVCN